MSHAPDSSQPPAARLPSPLTRQRLADLYFLEHRARVIDIAAFLDRLDRAADGPGPDDFRVAALRRALAILIDGRGERARRVLELLSDHSSDPVDHAPSKGAAGAPPHTPD